MTTASTTVQTNAGARRPAMNVLNAIMGAHWAMEEYALRTMLEIAGRENLTPEAVAARLGRPLDNTHAVTLRDGVATIPVNGPLFRYADFFSEISGATTYEQLATDVTRALDDRQVRAILLEIDSPGGEVNGCSQLAALIASVRGVKPIVAFVSGIGASAAYWLAAAADAVIVSDTGLAGSIGVRMAYRDTRAVDQARGVKTIEIVSSQSPNKRMDPTEDAGRAALQLVIDATAQVFVDAVAAYRGVSPEAVLADFGQGGMFVGRAAVDAGLADAVGTYESTFAALRDRGEAAVAEWRGKPKSRATAESGRSRADATAAVAAAAVPLPSTSERPMADEKTPPAAPARPPAAQETPAAGAPTTTTSTAVVDLDAVRKGERERIAAIRTLGRSADAALVERCINDGMSAEAAAKVFLEAQQQGAAAKLEQLRGDEKTPTPAAGASASDGPSAKQAAKAATAAYYAQSAPRAITTTTK